MNTNISSMIVRSALIALAGVGSMTASANPGTSVQDPQRLAQALLVKEPPAASGLRATASTPVLDPQQQAIRLLTGNSGGVSGSPVSARSGVGARNFDSHEAARRLLGRGV
jgi:hypothetical protein